MRRATLIACLVVVAAATAGVVSGAQTAFPGKNGKIYYVDTRGLHVLSTDGAVADLAPAGVGSVDVSAGGKLVAFHRCSGSTCEIVTMDADGSNMRVLAGPGMNLAPRWSRDGRRVLFHTNRDGNFELYVMNTDGSGQTRLTNSADDDSYGAWSPDGTKIAWTISNRNPAGCGSGGFGGVNPNYELWVMNADGTGARQLTPSAAPCDTLADWSPDGTQIVYAETGSTPPVNIGARIAIVNADGTGRRQLSGAGRGALATSWSPDGAHIAVARPPSFGSSGDPPGIFLVPAADGGATQLNVPTSFSFGGGAAAVDWAAVPPPPPPPPKATPAPYCKAGQVSTRAKPCRTVPYCKAGQKSTKAKPCRTRPPLCKPGQRSTKTKPCRRK